MVLMLPPLLLFLCCSCCCYFVVIVVVVAPSPPICSDWRNGLLIHHHPCRHMPLSAAPSYIPIFTSTTLSSSKIPQWRQLTHLSQQHHHCCCQQLHDAVVARRRHQLRLWHCLPRGKGRRKEEGGR